MHAAARAGEPFELVVLDGQMPGMDGIELAQAIPLAPSLRGARLIMLTSTTDRRAGGARGRHRPLPAEAGPPRAAARGDRRGDGRRARAPMPPAAELDAPRPRRPRATATVLVVEDNAVNQRVIEAMLAKRGYAVECAGNGREALSMLAVRSLRARLHGLPDAGDGRLRGDRRDPQPRARHRRACRSSP